ncbi:MAG: heme exporter protein CcmD [Alphaproteobacteria bacterium]
MDALTAFFHMGGYGIYVWPAFAVAALVLGGLLYASLRTLRANEAAVAEFQAARSNSPKGGEGGEGTAGDAR